MLDLVGQLGTWGPLMILLTLATMILVIRFGLNLFGKNPDHTADINQIPILAVLVLAIGAFSHYSGLYMGLQIFGDMSPAMFAGGYAVSLLAMMYGLVVFILSTICWFVLRAKVRSLVRVA